MPAPLPLFALTTADQIGQAVMNGLAVAGGFAIGYFLGIIITFTLDRWVLPRKSPLNLKRAVRMLCGIALAILIAYLVFRGSGGWGLGGQAGNGKGTGESTGKTASSSQSSDTTDTRKSSNGDPRKTPDVRPAGTTIRVTFLGGDAVQGDRFYRLGDDSTPLTFGELKDAVLKRKDEPPRPLYLEVRFLADPTQRIDESSINVKQVTEWARNTAGLEVVWPKK